MSCSINDKRLRLLGDALQNATLLTHLALNGNDFGSEALCEFVTKVSSLKRLNLERIVILSFEFTVSFVVF